MARAGAGSIPVERVAVHAFEFPADGPDGQEQDGTLTWSSTVMVLVEACAGGTAGIGYTYGDVSVAALVESKLASAVTGAGALAPPAAWREMSVQLRNAGQPGPGAMAMSAVDIALWDLKARLLGQPLYRTLPAFRDQVLIYGSGGFTNYSIQRLTAQVSEWAAQGLPRMKLKTSRHPDADPARLTTVRKEAGDGVQLFTDANGALSRKGALYWAERFASEWGVCWFEEPVSSQDTDGLRLLRDRGPAGLDIAAGEYGYVLPDFAALLDAGAVDCLQADVTRCGGLTGLLQVGGLAEARQVELSGHCAPAVSAHAFCAVPHVRHLEYFHTHVRIEDIAFDGTLSPEGGALRPDPGRAGLGLDVRWADLERYRVYGSQSGH
ncbi:MAG TPA: enolase C-terminal domain-like protein [Streptosporangiaceae bacterium]|nr:enolase C-terminal domain-like protein [Streptosporangiaceae bacterium]